MDKYEITVGTFNKLAEKYQEKYIDFSFYFDTYDQFCELITSRDATIFEIACGPGNITRYLLSKRPDFRIDGIDEDVAKLIVDVRALLKEDGILYLSTMEGDYEKSGFQTSADGHFSGHRNLMNWIPYYSSTTHFGTGL